MDDLFKKLMNGELPFRASIASENGESSSMKVQDVSIVTNGVERKLIDETIELSVNSNNGDKFSKASAIISVPADINKKSFVENLGNSSVTNSNIPYKIKLPDDNKKYKIYNSKKTLFAKFKVEIQKNKGYQCLHIFFGKCGQLELTNREGEKNRPHISIQPQGNSEFVRLSSYKCQIKNLLRYEKNTIYPEQINISIEDYDEDLFLKFDFNKERQEVHLVQAVFINKLNSSK